MTDTNTTETTTVDSISPDQHATDPLRFVASDYDITWTKSPEDAMIVAIQGAIETVFDPEFPLIDIWTMGLIYDIGVDEAQDIIAINMTYTTPACPSGELMQEMMTNAINEVYPAFLVTISITFDPMWTIEMIKDEDLQRMFE